MLEKSNQQPRLGRLTKLEKLQAGFLLNNHFGLAHLIILVKEMGELQDHMADIQRLLLDLGSV